MHCESTLLVANGLRRLYELLKELSESDWFDTAFDATAKLIDKVVHSDAFGFTLIGGLLLTGFLVLEGVRLRRERRAAASDQATAEPTQTSSAP